MSEEETAIHPAVMATERWLKNCVIKLKLCPFAAEPYEKGEVQIRVCESDSQQALLEVLLDEARQLDSQPEVATTLLVFPQALSDFHEFNFFRSHAERVLRQAAYEGIYQLASFHPQYQFADAAEESRQNFSNRSPFATLQLLREQDISAALAQYARPQLIFEANIRRLEALSDADIRHYFPYLD